MYNNFRIFHIFVFLCSNIFCLVEKKIIVVITAYNVEHSIQRTLHSVFKQKYTNFHIILVNDASTDNTKNMIETCVKECDKKINITCIHNNIRRRKLANLYLILHAIADDDIVFLLDGDDWLSHDQVLSRINQIYENKKIWMTYGNYKNVPVKEALFWNVAAPKYCGRVSDDIIKEKKYRTQPFVYMHPRTFYAWLFKLVRLEDLISEKVEDFIGDFFPACNDKAMFFPMIEMAGNHVRFIDDVLYYRNLYSRFVGFKIDKKLQLAAGAEIKEKLIYPTLRYPRKKRENINKKDIAIIINFREIHENLVKGINYLCENFSEYAIFLFYKKNTENDIKKLMSYIDKNVKLISYNEQNIEKLLHTFIFKKFKYILYIDDLSYLKLLGQEILDITNWLKKTFSPICIFGEKPTNMVLIAENIYAWKRVLNKNLPTIKAAMIEIKFLQKKCNNAKNINESFEHYINSNKYNLGLYCMI